MATAQATKEADKPQAAQAKGDEPKKRGRRPMTDEEKAAAKAAREAAKAAGAPAPAKKKPGRKPKATVVAEPSKSPILKPEELPFGYALEVHAFVEKALAARTSN